MNIGYINQTQDLTGGLLNGSEANPSISFLNDPTTGLYLNGSNLALSVQGNLKMHLTPSHTEIFQPTRFARGDASAPGISWEGDSNCGLFLGSNDNICVSTAGTLRLRVTDGLVMSSPIRLQSGTAALPGLTFSDGADTDTGIFRFGANQLSVSTSGIERTRVSTTQFASFVPIEIPVGTNVAPGLFFAGDSNTGLFSPAADQLSLVTNGIARISMSSFITLNGAVSIPTGSISSPSIAFSGDGDTGVYRPGVNTIGFVAGGIDRLRVSDVSIEPNVVVDMQAAQPCLLYTYASQSIASLTATTFTTASGTLQRDIGGFTVGATLMTIPSEGTYLVFGSISLASVNANTTRISIIVNGVDQAVNQSVGSTLAAPSYTTSACLQLSASSTVGLRVLHDAAGAINMTGRLQIVRIF